jgi:hypothetical protein
MPKLSFQSRGSFVKFMARKLAGSHSRPLHCGRQAASEFKNCTVILRLDQVWSKPRQVKDTPESVAAA